VTFSPLIDPQVKHVVQNTFARIGEITDPCGVPLPVSDPSVSSMIPAASHL
jgi:hypothetical protein